VAGNYGYAATTYVFRVRSVNGGVAWFVAATPGEAIDAYKSLSSPKLDAFETEELSVVIVPATQNITTDASAGASSGVTATAAAWATTYAAAVAAGASGANSSQGTQKLLGRTS
jgi:hypothetical protein